MAQLDDLLGESVTPEMRSDLEKHFHNCEHCFITMNTTKKTIEIYREQELYPMSEDLRQRLHKAILSKCHKC